MTVPASPDKPLPDAPSPASPDRDDSSVLTERTPEKLNGHSSPLIFCENDKLGRVEPGVELDEDEVSGLNTDEPKPVTDATPRTNGHAHDDSVNDEHYDGERPVKRQRRDMTPPSAARKPKATSPPWKKFEALGPTSYSDNGRRRSGRVNLIPMELQTANSKRITRGAATVTSPPPKNATPSTKTSKAPPRSQKRTASAAKSTPSRAVSSRSTVNSQQVSSKRPAAQSPSTTRSNRRRTPSPSPRQPGRTRRSGRFSDNGDQTTHYHDSAKSPRIKLRVTRSGTIPLVHADQVRKRPKLGTSFDDYLARAADISVEEGGLRASEDGPPYTDEAATRDARAIIRIEDEVEPGGLLSVGRCSIFVPEGVEEPPKQYARQDHMIKAMTNFRKLMLGEQQRHRATAKRIAEACRDEWLRRQPKSAEQIEAEARDFWMVKYRLVARTMFGTWEGVRAEVNKRRLEEWEIEEQKRVKAALNEAVSKSEAQLQARQGGLESEMASDEDGFSDLSDDIDGEDEGNSILGSDGENEQDENNMSSSDDEEVDDAEEACDEGLTQEQLREKYANIPTLEAEEPSKPESSQAVPNGVESHKDTSTLSDEGETSDESTDMDDDMGSEDDEDMDDEDDEDDEDEDDEDDAGGLLGLLFGKSELKKMEKEASDMVETADEAKIEDVKTEEATVQEEWHDKINGAHGSGDEEDDEVDDNEVSLVQYVDSETASGVVTRASSAQPESSSSTNKKLDLASLNAANHSEHAGKEDVLPNGAPPPVVTEGESAPTASTPLAEKKVDEQMPDAEIQSEAVQHHQGEPEDESAPIETVEAPEQSVSVSKTPDTSPSPQPPRNTDVPFLLRGTLREYQHDGLDWLAGLYANNTNGILADEMGLGKTIQTIALLAHLACYHEVWGPHLVIVPTSVMLNWEMEFKKWCPGFKILAYYGSQEERKRKRQGWNNDDVWNVCITSYQLVLQDQQVFKRRRWHYMILDEAHNIKNFKSQRWQTLLGFNTQARLLLTGTPLQNNLTELWSLLFFLMPAENGVGGFADLQEFHDWFHKPESQILESGREQMDDEAKAIISKLHKVLRPYLLRRLKADVEKQMPAKYEHVEFCRLSKRQRELYDGFLSRADTKQTLASGNYMSIINCLMQLRKVCNHPDLFVDRPIMTSFRMQQSVPSEYLHTERTVHRRLLTKEPMSTVSLGFLNLIPTQYEYLSTTKAESIAKLSSNRTLADLREAQRARAHHAYTNLDPSTMESNLFYLESASRWGRFEELQHCVYTNALRRQQRPIYGKNLVDRLTIGINERPAKPRPKIPSKIMAWFEEDSSFIRAMVHSVDQRADSLRTLIEKFTCVTPAVVTRDLGPVVLGQEGVNAFAEADLRLSAPVRWTPWMQPEPPADPWHEARMRHSIQFPDKRLLQYDCGKLQVLDGLLRKLQAGGHRALIFTQMTKVLDILEQFLNIHGHKYLRLDGATKVEQRQILTDRFNHDPRILCFILSTRSGGLGINLTGADTVIFYDQDWNPAMDKQCQDRCHRIGQTRDVHIYRLISEHTIEANILRKASQKQMLDDVVIQEGGFTTDHFNKLSVRDVLGEKVDYLSEGVAAADAALDRVLGGSDHTQTDRSVGRVLEQAEDREDVTAARAAEKEIQADDADFTEKPNASTNASGTSTARQGTPATKSVLDGGILDDHDSLNPDEPVEINAWGHKIRTIDDYMITTMWEYLKDTKLEIPKDKKKSKKRGKDTRKR